MALNSIWCCVLQRYVTRVTNIETEIVAIICPEVDVPTGTCSLKTLAMRGGFLTNLRRSDGANPIEKSALRCPFA